MAFLWSLAILAISGKCQLEWLQRFSFQVSLSAKPSPCSKALSLKHDKEWLWKVVMTHASHGWGEWPIVLSSRAIICGEVDTHTTPWREVCQEELTWNNIMNWHKNDIITPVKWKKGTCFNEQKFIFLFCYNSILPRRILMKFCIPTWK